MGRVMIVSTRVEARMKAAGLSQAELARRVGVAQPTIFKLIRNSKKGSVHLHRIARELGTTAAYLTGETDDPDADAPPLPDLDAQERELIDGFRLLETAERAALLTIARALANGAGAGTVHSPARDFQPGR